MNPSICDNKKSRGRPPSGIKKKLVAMRVTDDEAMVVKECLRNARSGKTTKLVYGNADRGTETKLTIKPDSIAVDMAHQDNVRKLLDDVERLEREKADLARRLDICSKATDDQKAKWWMAKYLALESSMKK